MTQIVACPHCGLKLGLPEDFAGKLVRCTKCKETFTAPASEPVAPATDANRVSEAIPRPPLRREPDEDRDRRGRDVRRERQDDDDDDRDRRRKRRRYADDDDYDDIRNDRYRRRDQEPHRGALILTLGILSIVMCPIFAPVAWMLGNHDLREIEAGRMENDGGLTQAGRIIGIIYSILMIAVVGFWVLIIMFAALAQR